MKIEDTCPMCGGKEVDSCVSNDSYGVYDDCECAACEFSSTREEWNHLSKQRQLLEKIARVAGGKTLESVSMPRDIYEVLS